MLKSGPTLLVWLTLAASVFAAEAPKGMLPIGKKGKALNTDFETGDLRDWTATGTVTSAAFKVTQPWAAFLLGGGSHAETRVELVLVEGGKVFFTARGQNNETLTPIVVDLAAQKNKEIFIRIVDEHTGGWGHVNFDDFRLHAQKRAFAAGCRSGMWWTT